MEGLLRERSKLDLVVVPKSNYHISPNAKTASHCDNILDFLIGSVQLLICKSTNIQARIPAQSGDLGCICSKHVPKTCFGEHELPQDP